MTQKSSRLAALVIAGSVTALATRQRLENLPAPNGGLVCGEADEKFILTGVRGGRAQRPLEFP